MIRRAVQRALLAIVVLLIAAIAFLHTRWGKELVRRELEARLAARVTGSVHIGSLDYAFPFGAIHVADVDIAGADGRSVIRIDRVDVALDRGSLLSGAPVIDALAVHGLAVSVVTHPDGSTNLTGLFVASDDARPDITVDHFAVAGGIDVETAAGTHVTVANLALRGRASPQSLTIDSVDADVACGPEGTVALSATSDSESAHTSPISQEKKGTVATTRQARTCASASRRSRSVRRASMSSCRGSTSGRCPCDQRRARSRSRPASCGWRSTARGSSMGSRSSWRCRDGPTGAWSTAGSTPARCTSGSAARPT